MKRALLQPLPFPVKIRWEKPMKRFRLFLLSFAILAFAIAAAGDGIPDIHIVFDPAVPAAPGFNNLYVIQSAGVLYSVAWLSCGAYSTFNPAPQFDACLGFFNNTGSPVSDFDISFTVPGTGPGSELIGQPVNCSTLGPNLTDNTCPTGTLSAGETADIGFFGGTSVPNETAFFVGEDGVACANPSDGLVCSSLPPAIIADDSAPEPATGILLLSGLMAVAGLGAGMNLKRRRA